jgi:hypothetical protein
MQMGQASRDSRLKVIWWLSVKKRTHFMKHTGDSITAGYEFSHMKMRNTWRKEHGMDPEVSLWILIIVGLVGFLAFALLLDIMGV